MSKIYMNGKCFTVEGSLSMINGRWYGGAEREIDMNNLEGMSEAKTINITIEGNVDRLDVDHCSNIIINGDCKKVKTTSGDIKCHNIDSDAESVSGDIECEIIHCDAKTVSGDIRSTEIIGRSSTTIGKVNGKRRSCSDGGFSFDSKMGSVFGNSYSKNVTFGEVIGGGGITITNTSDGKKHMTLHKDNTVNGRRIVDMSESELHAWIEAMARKNKIITII